jgi:CHAT domain-containing protein/tetratricopeptide (TPR) repeat protein
MNQLVEQLLGATTAAELEQLIAVLQPQLNLTTISELKAHVDATKLRNAGRAMAIAEVALAVAQHIDDPLAMGLADWACGNACYHLSRFEQALACYGRAEAVYAAGDHLLEVTRLRINQVAVLQDTGAFAEALAIAERARADCAALGAAARPFLALLEMNTGAAYQQLARPAEALAAYARGRAIFVELDDAVQTARMDINRANVLQEMGQFAEAAALYAAARNTLQRNDLAQEVARAEHNMGKLAYRRGRYHEALRSLEAARQGYAAIPNPLEVAKADLYRALVYRDLNLLDETVDLATAALGLFARAGTRWERAMATLVAGMAHARLRNFGPATVLLHRARRLLRQQGALERLPPLDADRAELLLAQGQVASARRLAQRLQRQVDPALWPALAVRAQLMLARCALLASPPDPANALRLAQVAQKQAEQHQLPELVAVLHTVGDAALALAQPDAAWGAYRAAMQAVEHLRARLPLDELQLAFLDDKQPLYRSAALLAMQQPAPEHALAALSQLLNNPLPRPTVVNNGAMQELEALREQWHWQQSRLDDLIEGTTARNAEERAVALQHSNQLEHAIADVMLRQASWMATAGEHEAQTTPLALEEAPALLRELQAALHPAEGLLVAVPLGNQAALVLVTRSQIERLLHPIPQLERTLRSWRFHVQHLATSQPEAAALAAARPHLARFYQNLLAPLAPAMANLHTLILALDPAWHDLPFAAAFDGQSYLVERFVLRYVSSPQALVGALGRTQHAAPLPHADQHALVIGCSDGGRLPAAIDEARAVAAALDPRPVSLMLEEEATPEQVLAALSNSSLIHLASHAFYRPDNPRFSWVRLGEGRLAVADLASVRLPHRPLIVLSGCETGRGLPRGGGLLGMARAFAVAGAATMLVSLWKLVDSSAATLMGDFYQSYNTNADPAMALAHAQRLACARGEHPLHWAGYVCVEG